VSRESSSGSEDPREVDKDYETLKPDSFKGYTVGDSTNKNLSRHPWHLDDEKLLYPFYERLAKWSKTTPNLANVCIFYCKIPSGIPTFFTPTLTRPLRGGGDKNSFPFRGKGTLEAQQKVGMGVGYP